MELEQVNILPQPAMSDQTPPTIDPIAARRWLARLPHAAPWLHEEVARRMAERLDIIRLPVQRWADWEPSQGGRQGHALVAAHYPDAECYEVTAQHRSASDAPKKIANHWWNVFVRGRESAPQVVAAPPEGQMQLVWANMLAHQVSHPAQLLADWHRALAVDGFVLFSCLGPDTLRELRPLYAEQGWPPLAHEFTDMHDWGDQLVAAGFAEPVMDMELITLTFETPERLLQELRELGRNLHLDRFAGLRTRAWRAHLAEAMDTGLRRGGASTPLSITFEIVYGHALKAPPRLAVAPRTEISEAQMRASLRQSKKNFPPH